MIAFAQCKSNSNLFEIEHTYKNLASLKDLFEANPPKCGCYIRTSIFYGPSVEVLLSAKHFWSFTAKQFCSILLNNWFIWGLVRNNKTGPHSLSGIIQVSGSPEIQSWFEKALFIL